MGASYQSCNTQSSAPEDGQNNRPKHVELIGIINKPLLLHLVGCLYYLPCSVRKTDAEILVKVYYVPFAFPASKKRTNVVTN